MPPLFTTHDGIPVYDEDRIWVIRRPVTYGEPQPLHVFRTAWHLYKNKGYYFFAEKENALSFVAQLKTSSMLEFKNPIPVIVEGDKEGYAIYVRDGSTWENDIWAVCHCEGGIVRHYRSDQIRVNQNATFDIKKQDK